MNTVLGVNETMEDFVGALKTSFETVSGVAPIAYWYENLNEQGRIKDIHFSDAMRRMLGYRTKEEFPDSLDTIKERTHPDDLHVMLEHAIETATGRMGRYDVQCRIRKASGEYMWCNATGRLVKDSEGRTVGMYGAFIDISGEMELQKRLEAERGLQSLANGGEESILFTRVTEKLMDEYDAIYVVNLERNEIRPVRSSRVSDVGAFSEATAYDVLIRNFAATVDSKYREEWENFADPKYMQRYMAESDHREYLYELPDAERRMRRFSVDVLERNEGVATGLLFSFAGIDDITARTISFQLHMVDAAQHEKLRADALDFVLRNDELEPFVDFFSGRVLELYGCDQVIYRDIEDRMIIKEKPGTPPLDFSLCKDCPHFAFDAPVYADGFTAMDDCSVGYRGIPVHADCPVKASLTYLVHEGDRVFGYIALHYLGRPHGFSDDEKRTFDRVAKLLTVVLTRRKERRAKDAALESVRKANRLTEAFEQALDADSVFVIDCENDVRRTVHDSGRKRSEYTDEEKYSVSMNRYIDTYVVEGDRDTLRRATEPKAMLNRARKEGEFRIEFRDDTSGTRRFYEMKVVYQSDTEVVQSFKEKDREIINRMIMESLQYDYFALFAVDLDSGILRVVKDDSQRLLGEVGSARPYEEAMRFFAPHFPSGPREFFERISDIDHLRERFSKDNLATFQYQFALIDRTKWCNVAELVLSRHEDGTPSLFAIVFSLMDEEAAKRAELQQQLMARDRAAVAKDQILSAVTQALYSFNLTVDLKSGGFQMITGTGGDEAIAVMKEAKSYREAYDKMLSRIRPQYHDKLRELISLDYLWMNRRHAGYFGNVVYETESSLWGEINVTFGTDDAGRPIANLLGRDITAARREQARQEREIRAAQAKNEILSGVTQALYGANITVNLVEDSFTLITGTGAEQLCDLIKACLERPYTELVDRFIAQVPDDHRDEALRAFGRDVLIGHRHRHGYICTCTIPWKCPDGSVHWLESNAFISENEKGEPIANLLGRDVTAEIEQDLQQEREREIIADRNRILSDITKARYGYNVTVDLKTLKCSVISGTGCDGAVEIFEHCADYGSVVQEFQKRITDAEARKRALELLDVKSIRRMAAEGRRGYIGTVTYPTKSANPGEAGSVGWREAGLYLGVNAAGETVANILGRNSTEDHLKEESAEKLKVAEAANRAKTQFLFNMSHDIRTPMNAIMGFTEMADRKLKGIAGKVKRSDAVEVSEVAECLAKISESSELMVAIINSILDMSRIEAGKEQLAEVPADIMKSFDGLSSTVQAMAKSKNIDLTFEFGEIPDRNVYCDRDKVKRVFVNMISNAVKYTNVGGWVKVTCEQVTGMKGTGNVELKPGYAWYRYTFSDNGIGMSEEFQKHVFEEFARERNSTTSGVIGTGLGLALCKSFVELMGGTIECRSKQGEGTTFIVELPLRVREQETVNGDQAKEVSRPSRTSRTAQTVPASETAQPFTGKRVLLVEDNELNREVAEFVLIEQGFTVEVAGDGSVAVGMVKEKGLAYYDYVLMDIQMPIMNGLEATRAIREYEARSTKRSARGAKHAGHLPIIALSANAFAEDKAASLAAGMDDHVAKPIKVNVLMEALRNAGRITSA